MIRNYVVVAIRNLARHRFFSAINIFGLAISMSVCMAIIMLVADQMMYDRYNKNRDRIYRVNSRAVTDTGSERGDLENATAPMALREGLLHNYTGVEKVVRLRRGFGNHWMELEGQNVTIPVKGFFADPEVLDFFGYELEHGDAATALVNPFSVVLTRQAAHKLFREENPVGMTLEVGEHDVYTVTGVLKETNNKSHIVFEGLASMATVKSLHAAGRDFDNMDDWMDFWNAWNYVLLAPDKSPSDVALHLDELYRKHIASVNNPEAYKAKFVLQPLLKITPGALTNNSIGPSMPWIMIYFLGGLAAVIMLTSCFNFTNLSVARALTRAREIGVRKVSGAARVQIFIQFLSEAVVVSLFSLVLALLLVFLMKPLLLQLNFARVFQWDLQANYVVYGVFLAFAVAVGLLAGIFPATVLSAFQPVKVLKKLNDVKLFSRLAIRKVLIVAQFTLSLIFILSVIVLYNQLHLFLGKDHGFNTAQNLVIRLNGTSASALKAELSNYPGILSVSAASHLPAIGESRGNGYKRQSADPEWISLYQFAADENYLTNMSITLLNGHYFAEADGTSNEKYVVINEEAVKALHYDSPLDAIGEEVIYRPDSSRKTIIGVIKNYNHQILFSRIEPMALLYTPQEFGQLQVKYAGSYETAVATVEKAWKHVNPGKKIDCTSMQEKVNRFYDTTFGDLVHIVGVIAILAIVISCLGLMGMATYTIETRIKEISIRKVLGSSDRQLVILLSRGFLGLLLIAVAVGIPAGWFLNNLWLEMIAYRTTFSLPVFVTAVSILFVFGGITIGSQTLRGAFTNPVDNLKNE